MELVYRDGRFEFDCLVAENSVPKGAGFKFDWLKRVWYTKQVEVAFALSSYGCADFIQQELNKSTPVLEYEGGCFVWKASFVQRGLAKDAGFIWDAELGYWFTDDWQKAESLVYLYGTANCIRVVSNFKRGYINNLTKSYSAGVDVKLPAPYGLDYLPYQKSGILYGADKPAVLIGDEMGCITGDALINIQRHSCANTYTLEKLFERFHSKKNTSPIYTDSYHKGRLYKNEIVNVLDKGVKPVISFSLGDHRDLKLTADHEVLTARGFIPAGELVVGDKVCVEGTSICIHCGKAGNISLRGSYPGVCKHCIYSVYKRREDGREIYQRALVQNLISGVKDSSLCGHKGVLYSPVVYKEVLGEERVYDIVMKDPARNFVVNGIVVHNCGKTIQGIGLLNLALNNFIYPRVLVLCPASLKLNWERELNKWLIDDMDIQVLSSKDTFNRRADITIVNYDIVDKFVSELYSVHWDYLIMDEAHLLKNPKTKRAKVVFGDGGSEFKGIQADRKIALTGTPIPNRPVELHALLSYLDPTSWRSFSDFAHKYCAAKKGRFGLDATGASNLGELAERLRATLMIRRLKSDVLPELPEKTFQILPLPGPKRLLEAEKKLESQYESIQDQYSVALQKASETHGDYATTLRTLSAEKFKCMGEMSRISKEMGIAKAPLVIDYLRDIVSAEHKVIVFATHRDVVAQITEAFKDCCVSITGDTPMHKRQEAVDRFQNDASIHLFVGNIVAAGTGLTLTASSHVCFVEFDWTPGLMQQAADRAHRIGQKNNVLIQYIAFDKSLDINKLNTLVQKETVQKAVLDSVMI